MKSEKAKIVFIIILSVLLAMSIFAQVLLCSLLGIKNVASLKRVMLANDTLASMTAPEVEIATEPQTNTPVVSTPPVTKPTESVSTNDTKVILDSAGIKVTYVGTEYDSFWEGPALKFAIENNSDTNVIINSTEESVNGFMTDIGIGMYSEVLAGKKAVEGMTLYAFELEPLGITDPKTVEFKLSVSNSDDVFDNIVETDTITIEIN